MTISWCGARAACGLSRPRAIDPTRDSGGSGLPIPKLLIHRACRVAIAVTLSSLLIDGARAEGEVDAFRTRLEKWVETRRILSEERAGWQVEREILRDTRKLLQQQEEELREKLAATEEATTEAEDARRELLLTRGEHQRANRSLEEAVRRLESQTACAHREAAEPPRFEDRAADGPDPRRPRSGGRPAGSTPRHRARRDLAGRAVRCQCAPRR